MNTIKIKKLSSKAILPTRNVSTDAGLDLYAAESVFIPVGSTVKVSTDIVVNIEPGYFGLVCDRSSMGVKGLRTGAGVIDAGYNGHLCVVLHNLNNTSYNEVIQDDLCTGYQIKVGDKIAQLIIQPISLPIVEEVNELSPTERGNNGFGSSGV
jgi:dUTP pyrophosphatase